MTTRRLEQRRQWFSLEDAVRYVEAALGEPVATADLLQMALDADLALSLDVVEGTPAHSEACVQWRAEKGLPGGRGYCLCGQHIAISGVWDVPLMGDARRHVSSLRAEMQHGAHTDLTGIGGAWVARDGERRQLEPVKAVPTGMSPVRASAFPRDSVLGVRRSVLDAFIATVNAPMLTSPSHGTEEEGRNPSRRERGDETTEEESSGTRNQAFGANDSATAQESARRKHELNAFLEHVNETLSSHYPKLSREDFGRVAGYSDRTIRYWLSVHPKAGPRCNEKVRALLSQSPEQFAKRALRSRGGK